MVENSGNHDKVAKDSLAGKGHPKDATKGKDEQRVSTDTHPKNARKYQEMPGERSEPEEGQNAEKKFANRNDSNEIQGHSNKPVTNKDGSKDGMMNEGDSTNHMHKPEEQSA